MANSKLIHYIDYGLNIASAVRSTNISKITIHHAQARFDLNLLARTLRNVKTASWNYGISEDGKIGLFVDESKQAISTSNTDNDQKAINIIVSNNTNTSPWTISNDTYMALVRLCIDICQRNNIPKLVFANSAEDSNLTIHKWFASVDCPGEYIESKLPQIVTEVNLRLALNENLSRYIPSSIESVDDNMFSSVLNGILDISTLNIDKLNPYIVTINQNTTSVNYNNLKEMGVSGAIIEAGRLYDDLHIAKKSFTSPNLSKQIQAADDANMPWGLYSKTSVVSIDAARKEADCIKRIIRKYSPTLGYWLKLNFVKDKTINDRILDEYYKMFTTVGMEDKIGLYATKEQLSKVSWDKQCDNWYLWLISRVSSISEFDDVVLSPTFFSI